MISPGQLGDGPHVGFEFVGVAAARSSPTEGDEMPGHERDAMPLPRELDYLRPLVMADMCRLGRNNDGGYIVPRSVLTSSEYLISFGLSFDWSFEKAFKLHKPEIQIDAYDHSMSQSAIFLRAAKSIVKAALFQISPGRAVQILREIVDYFTTMHHFVRRVSPTKIDEMDITVEEVFSRAPRGKRIFLKMDIEGSEYDIIPDVLQYSRDLTGMIIEFHDTGRLRTKFKQRVETLLEKFEIVHIHGNNWSGVSVDGLPDALEVTFVNKEYCPVFAPRREALPLEIDQPNHRGRPDMSIMFYPEPTSATSA
jgi:hypothetical protein